MCEALEDLMKDVIDERGNQAVSFSSSFSLDKFKYI